MTSRLNERVKVSDRIDDTFDAIKKRITNYQDQTVQVYDYYRNFGKVRTVDGLLEYPERYQLTKDCMMPQIFMIIGPKKSGKTTLAIEVGKRTNMKNINFNEFLKKNGLREKSDEEKVLGLINSFFYEIEPRVIVEGFP
jgi:adenylate kinase family enzyme